MRTKFLRFALVGSVAVLIDASLYVAFVNWAAISPIWAKRMSFCVGSIWAFFANKYFTFKIFKTSLKEPFLFTIAYFIGWALNSLTHDSAQQYFNSNRVAFLAATAVSTCSNFILIKILVFRSNSV